jgi:XTP/dITP diphosphohydrolase
VAPAWLQANRRLVVATGNAGKLREVRSILAGRGFTLCDLSSLPVDPPLRLPEEGPEYAPNAVAKARVVAAHFGLCALADDSGLEVEALGGEPGPYSARFGGPGLDDADRVRHLLAELASAVAAGGTRRARFVCHVALASPAGDLATASGECTGVIVEVPWGSGGFGYDPAFRPNGFERTFAELPEDTKNAISHRARALRALFGPAGAHAPDGITPRAARGGP